MKIGLVVHFFDFRNDVRVWMEALQKENEVVLFVKPEDAETILRMVPKGTEIRSIDERKKNLWNTCWELAFRFL